MKQYSFSFSPELLEEFKSTIPSYKSKKILKHFLLKEYTLPDNVEVLKEEIHAAVVQPYWMDQQEVTQLDRLVSEARRKGVNVSKSAIMRDIMKCLIKRYEDTSASEEQSRQTFKIPAGTKERLSKIVQDRYLTYELSSFIMEGYVPSNDFPSMRNQNQEDLNFRTDTEVFEKMDDFANQYGFKKGGRAKIFRDALSQFEATLEKVSPKKAALQNELKYIINEYKSVEEISVIKEKINQYLRE